MCDLQLEILISQKQTTGLAVVGSLLCCLNVSGQFHVSKMAAQLSESQGRLEIWLDCDVTAWGIFSLQVHAGKIGKKFDLIWF